LPNHQTNNSDRNKARGSVAIIVGAGVWGLFWIPLHYLDMIGIEGMWAVVLTLGMPTIIAGPFLAGRIMRGIDKNYATLGTTIGLAVVLYFGAVLFTDVIRVVFLFYLLPVWTTLLGRLFNGETIRPRKLIAMLISFFGLYLLLGGGGNIPLPANLGDWFALASGFLWACSLVLIRHNAETDPFLSTTAPFVFGTPIAIAAAFLLAAYGQPVVTMPNSSDLWLGVLIAVVFGLLVLSPSIYLQVWGARFVPSSTAALLTMTEILAATISATLLIGTSMTRISALGGVLIIIAAVADLTTPAVSNRTPT
jgi:drug/metabolite transporter (DMT)-like permease